MKIIDNTGKSNYGKIKFDQIMATGARYCITPCHNCHAQIHDISHLFNGGFYVSNLWTFLALSLLFSWKMNVSISAKSCKVYGYRVWKAHQIRLLEKKSTSHHHTSLSEAG